MASTAAAPGLNAYKQLLTTYLRPHRRLLAWLSALLLLGIAVQVISPQLIGVFVDGAIRGAPQPELLLIAALFLAASIAQQMLLVGATYFSERVAWTATNGLRADLALHCLTLDAAFHEHHTPGELIERIDGDVTAVASFFSQFVIQVIGNVLLLVGILVMLWTFDPRVGYVLTIFAVVSLVVMLKARQVAVPYWVTFREASARLFGFIEERLNGLEDLRALGAEAHAVNGLGKHAHTRMRAASIARLMSSVPFALPIVVSALGIGLSFGMSVVLVGAGVLTIGAAFTLYFYTRLLVMPLSRISNQVEEFQRASAGIVRIQEVRAWRSEIEDPPHPLPIAGSGPLSIDLEHVDFAYRTGEPVLRDVSFALPAGASLGIVGRTGSGKTTITRLVVRQWDTLSGSVRVGGIDVRGLERASLRRRIGVVGQEPHVFAASVHHNVALFDSSVSETRVLDALEELGIADWARQLPNGLGTLVGSGGRGLSAGEAQLLGLARVFLHDPGLVILDEPSSRLDPATERLVTSAMERLLRGRTGLIVAHRPATLEQVDAVLVLDAGQVVDYRPKIVRSAPHGV